MSLHPPDDMSYRVSLFPQESARMVGNRKYYLREYRLSYSGRIIAKIFVWHSSGLVAGQFHISHVDGCYISESTGDTTALKRKDVNRYFDPFYSIIFEEMIEDCLGEALKLHAESLKFTNEIDWRSEEILPEDYYAL